MSDNNRLIYPTVDLFLYDLADGLGQSDKQINQNRLQFYKKIYGEILTNEELNKKLGNFQTREAEPSDYIELLGEDGLNFNSDDDGYYYPVKLGDTYALLVECSASQESSEKKNPTQSLDCLKPLKETIRAQVHNQRGKIGESWLVWGQLAAKDQDALETAKNCFENLELFPNPKWDQDLQTKGEFLGATFYELWRVPSDRGDISQNYHLLICLFPYKESESIKEATDNIIRFYPHFIQLFKFRNKIIWSYYQSRRLKSDIKSAAPYIKRLVNQISGQVNASKGDLKELEQNLPDSPQMQKVENQLSEPVKASKVDLKELQQNLRDSLQIFASYASYLGSLEEQQRTIKTHLINYQRRIKKIAKLAPEPRPDNALEFLETFTEFATEKYLPQIKADLASFSGGLRLLENAIKTIEGIIEIEQTKSEQDLAFIVGWGGISLAASGITATILSTQIQEPKPNSKEAIQKQEPKPNSKEAISIPTAEPISILAAFTWSFLILIPFLIALLIRFFRR